VEADTFNTLLPVGLPVGRDVGDFIF
jgi:hypothetical protein